MRQTHWRYPELFWSSAMRITGASACVDTSAQLHQSPILRRSSPRSHCIFLTLLAYHLHMLQTAASSSTPASTVPDKQLRVIGDGRGRRALSSLPNWLCWTAGRVRITDFKAVVRPCHQAALQAVLPSLHYDKHQSVHDQLVFGSHVDALRLLNQAMKTGHGFWFASTDTLPLQDVRLLLPGACDVALDGNKSTLIRDGLPLAVRPTQAGLRFWAKLHQCQARASRLDWHAGAARPPVLAPACIQDAMLMTGVSVCTWTSIDSFMYARSLNEFQAWGPKKAGIWPAAVRVTEELPAISDRNATVRGLQSSSLGGPPDTGTPHTANRLRKRRRWVHASALHGSLRGAHSLLCTQPFHTAHSADIRSRLAPLGLQATHDTGACHVHPAAVQLPRIDTFSLTIRILTMARPASLRRLLDSLAVVHFLGDRISLVISVDKATRGARSFCVRCDENS